MHDTDVRREACGLSGPRPVANVPGMTDTDTRKQQLMDRAVGVFAEQFDGAPAAAAIAPGRVNLIGEHTDYNDGFVLPMAIERHTLIVGRLNHSPRCRVVAGDMDEQMATFQLEGLAPGKTAWANYVKGVVAQFIANGHPVPGFDAVVVSDVPLGGGLSSSAALEVATASLLEHFLHVQIEPTHKALWCQAAEHEYANMPCGIMDQFIVTMGRRDHALLIDCRTHEARPVAMDDEAVAVLVTNSNVKHELTGSEYPTRRKQCAEAAQVLDDRFGSIAALRDATMAQLDQVRGELGEEGYRRARHVIGENGRTLLAEKAMNGHEWDQMGQFMLESHRTLRDDFEVSCPELDALVELAMNVPGGGVYGSRMTGGGFGGCTVTLLKTDAVERAIEHLHAEYPKRCGREPTCFVTRPADGATASALA